MVFYIYDFLYDIIEDLTGDEHTMHLEQTLLDVTVKYTDKIQKLTQAWTFLKPHWARADSKEQEDNAKSLMGSTVQMVLRAEWKTVAAALKAHLKRQISAFAQTLKSKDQPLASQCHLISLLLDDPWGDQALKDILQDKPFDDAAALNLLKSDRHILRTRLNILCEDKNCFELAQKLAAVVWLFYKRDRNLLSFFSDDDLHYILDLHLILLVRQGKQNNIITQMKELPMQQGAQFIKRLKHHHYPDRNKLWKKSRRALEIVVQLLATRAIREPLEDVRGTLKYLMAEWVEMFCLDPEFEVMIGKLAKLSISVDHLFALTEALELKCHEKHRSKCIEFFIKRFLLEVNDINDLRNLGNEAQLRAAEEHLSAGFLQLADLLSDSLESCRECVLTAFSLNPSAKCLERLEQLAMSSGIIKKEVLDTGQPDEQSMSAINDRYVPMEIKVEDGLDTDPTKSEVENGIAAAPIDQSLQDDLNVVLKTPRNRSLNWQLEWPDLKKRCEEHIVEMTRGERPSNKELKYLELDYSQFKHMRAEDENHDGIEKGYEIDSSTADEDCDEPGDLNHRSLEEGSDASYTIKKKSKPSEPTDPRIKKSKAPRTQKPYHLSSEESRSKHTINESLLNKKKSQRKPKCKTPKSDAKRSRKSSFTQFQVSSPKDLGFVGSPGSNYQSLQDYLVKKSPRDEGSLQSLRNFRHPKKGMGGPDQSLHMSKLGQDYHYPAMDLMSYDHLLPAQQRTTVQVVHVPGSVPPRTANSTITRPEDADRATASTEQVNGKPTQAGGSSGSSGSSGAQSSQQAGQGATFFNQGPGRMSLQAPGLAPLTNSRGMVRPGPPGLTQAPRPPQSRTWLPGPATTALPQFSTTFGSNRMDAAAAGSSALKQALLAPTQPPQPPQGGDRLAKLNPAPAAPAAQAAAGFGSHTQPAGFGAPAHPPGFGTPTQSSSQSTPLPPLQAVQARPTPPSPSSLPLQPEPPTPLQDQPPGLQQQAPLLQSLAVAGAPPPPAPLSAGTPTAAPVTTTPTTAQVIVTTSSGTLMSQAPPGLLLVASTTATPTTTPSQSTASSTTSSTSTSTGLALARNVVTVTSTKAPAAAVLVAGPTAQLRPPGVVGPVPTLRTFSAPSLDKAVRGPAVQIVQAVGAQAVKLAVVPALVQTGSQHVAVALPSVNTPPGVTAVAVAKRGIGARTRVSNPILGKYLKQQSDAAATTSTASTATPTTPPGAAAAAAAATAAARAEAANAPTNVSRPLYASSTPPSANDTLKEQLLEFESVLHHVHTTRQLKERQSLDGDNDPKPPQQPPQPPTPTTSVPPAAVAAPTPAAPTPAPTPPSTAPTTPTPAPTPAPPLAVVAAVTTSTVTSTSTAPALAAPRPVHTDASVQAGPGPQPPRAQTAQATTQTVVHTVRAVSMAMPVVGAVPVSLPVHKSVIPVTVSVAAVSSVNSTLPPTVTLSSPKKKPKVGKTLTVVAAPGTTVVTAPLTVVTAPAPAPATPTATTPAEQRHFKPNMMSTLSTAKHIGQKPGEDDLTTARIMNILKAYDEQLRCSPEMNNKPAPRRRNQVQPGAAASPTNKRKHKHKKGSVSELSPGTDDTHTMGSEDSSIASHFADGVMDGVMEATPTSPLSTCDDRSLASAAASTAATSGDAAAVPASSAVTSFAGVTKATTTTTESSDVATDAGSKTGSPVKGPTLVKVQTPPKVQMVTKVPQLTPQSMPQPLPKAPAPVVVSSPIMLPVALSLSTTTKATSPPKIVTTTAGKVQVLAKVPTPQTPPSLLKTTTLPKVRSLVKTQSLPKVQQLAPLVMLSSAKPGESVLASPQGVVVQTSKENQIFTVSSRVIQSVETVKPSENPVGDTAPPLQVTDQILQLAPASNQVSQLERALQSKPVTQTPLLARALKTPTTHLPTTFTGILSTTTRLSIAQPTSTVQLRALPKVSDSEVSPVDRAKLQRSDMSAAVSQLSQTIQIVNVKAEESSAKSSQPAKLSQSLQPETSLFNPMTEAVPSSTSTTPTTTMMTQQVPTAPIVMLPATSVELQLPPKAAASVVEPSQGNSDLMSQPHQQPNGNLLILTSPQPENVPPSLHSSTEVLTGTHLVQLASQQQSSDSGKQEPLLPLEKTQQVVEEALQVPQSSPQLPQAPPLPQMQQPTQIVKSLMQEQLAPQAVQQIQLGPQDAATSAGQGLDDQITSHMLQQEAQANLLQPTLQMESASEGLQAMSQTQLTSPMPQTMQQILEPLPQAQLNSQIVHSLTQEQSLQPRSQMQPNAQILQISSQAPPTSTIVQTVSQVSPLSQIVIPTSQILQTTSQGQLVDTAQMSQIMSSAPQLVQSLPQLVHSSKSTQPSQQRFGIQPVQLSATSTGQIRRIVSGDCTPQLVQIAQPQLIQSQQLQPAPQLLMPPSSQAVAVSLAGSYTPQKPIDTDEAKVTSPAKQSIVPLYMVPSSSASQLPVMISSATGMVHVNLVNSQAGPVVVRQVSKQDGKITRDSSHDIISVISCDSSQPLLLSSIQQLFGGNAPVVSTSHIGAAMTTQTTATVVASSAPMFSVGNVDSSVVTDTSVLTLNSAPVTSEIPVNVSSLISSSVSPSQMFQPLAATNQTPTSAPILEAPAPAPLSTQASPRAVTPSSASSIPPLTNTSPTGAPNRPTTLLALQQQQRSKQLRQQEEEEKRRLTQHHQQQQPQQLASQTDVTAQPLAAPELPQVVQLESPAQPLPGLQPTTQVAVLLTQREASKSPPKQPTRINVSPQKVKDESLEKFPVIIPRTKSRPTLLSSPPQYKTTEPKHLRHLLDSPPAPLPPLYQTGIRRLSNPTPSSVPAVTDQIKVTSSPVKQEDQPKAENQQVKQEDIKPDITAESIGGTPQKAESSEPPVKPSGESIPPTLSPLKHSSVTAASQEKLSGSSEMPMPQPSEEVLSASLPETPPPDFSSDKLSSLSPEKTPGNLTPEKLQLPIASPIRRLSFESPSDKLQSTPEKQMPVTLSSLSVEKGSPLSSPEKMSSSSVSELSSPMLVPLRVLPATSPEKQLLQTPKSSKSCPQSSSKHSPMKGKKSPKIYAVTKTIAKQTSPLKIPQKLASTKSQQLTSNMKSMVLTHSGLEALTSISDAVVLGQSENQSESETLFIRANVPQQSPIKGTDGSPTPDAGSITPGTVKVVTAKSGETNYQRLIELPEGTRRPQSQLPKLNLLSKLTATQALPQAVQQGPVSEAPPLAPMSAAKPAEPSTQKSFQLIDDTSANSKGLLSELHPHLRLDTKPASSPEVRVYPPSQGSMDSEKVGTKSKLPTVIPVSAPPLLLTSASSPTKATATVQVSYSALKSSGLKIQTPTQACVPSLTTAPLQVPRPPSAKAQAVTHERQTLLIPDTFSKLQTAPPALTVQNTSPVSSTAKGSQEDVATNVAPRPKRQRNRKRSSPRPQEKESTSQSSIGEPDLKLQQPSPKKNVDSETSPSKRSPKKKDNTGATPVTPEIVSQHLSDTIMRVSLGVDGVETNANEEFNPPLVKDEFEDQEKIPVEVAVAALCGEDIENAKDFIEGNLQGDMDARSAITLLPADPSESTEELNFFRNVVDNIPDENTTAGLENDCAVDSMSLNDNKSHPVTSSITACTVVDAADLDHSLKKESNLVSESKEDETVPSRIALKRKAIGSHSGSFSEHSRSLSGSDDLSMDKTSTSDIFPEPDILFETTLSPSFLGEIAQLSPTNSQDAVCASPEPVEKRKRGLAMKTLPKPEPEESKGVNKALPSIGSLGQFNGGNSRSEMSIDDSFKHTVIKQECSYLDSPMLDNPVAHILDDQETLSKTNQTLTSLAGSSAVSSFFSLKSGSSGDEASWEKETLFPNQASDNEEEPFWSEALASGVDIDLSQEGDTNSSSTPSETLSKSVKSSGRVSSQRTSISQTRKAGVKRKDDSASSPSQKQSGEKRKRVSSLTSNEEDEGSSKYGQVLRSSVTKPTRRDGVRSAASKEDTIQRRVSTRTHKPVTKFDDLTKKTKPSQNKQPPKTVTNKKK